MALLKRLLGKPERTAANLEHDIFLITPPERSEPTSRSTAAALELLDTIEADALAVYGRHGLPTRHGEYAKSQRAKHWRFVAERLTAEERWALYLENDKAKRWKFGALADLGMADPTAPDIVRQAAQLLVWCRETRELLLERKDPTTADNLIRAIELGAEWSLVRHIQRRASGPLTFISPADRAAGK